MITVTDYSIATEIERHDYRNRLQHCNRNMGIMRGITDYIIVTILESCGA